MKMGRCPKVQVAKQKNIKKGGWTEEEDQKLAKFINNHGLHGFTWDTISHKAGLNRCGKSCRLRWKNYLNPHIIRGNFTHDEESIIILLQSHLGNKWSQIAAKLPGRTDNDIKNLWNTKLSKKLQPNATSDDQYSYNSHPQLIIPITTDPNFLANYLISINLLGFLNTPQLLVQEWENKQQEIVMAPTSPNYPNSFLPESGYGFDNELDNGNSITPFEISTNDHMLPALVSAATDNEIPTQMITDELSVNPNYSLPSFDDCGWMASSSFYDDFSDLI